MILCPHFVHCTHCLPLWQDEMFFSLYRWFIVKIYKKIIHALWRKIHFIDEPLFSKSAADHPIVHWYFPHRVHNIPLFPNGLSDWLKNRHELRRRCWDYLVQVLAKTVKNSGFQSKSTNAPFFLAHPVGCIFFEIFPFYLTPVSKTILFI